MCLYPIKIKNRKYCANKKNGGDIPSPPIVDYDNTTDTIYRDLRVLTVEVPCGQCIECREQKAREWQIRLMEEIKDIQYPYFVTFTFDPWKLKKLARQTKLEECNAICAIALRRCLERYRKDEKKSLRHWFVTELGHEGTERIHMHGLLLSNKPLQWEKTEDDHFFKWKYWQYGNIYVGDYVNEKTVNYIVKYMNKIDTDHKGFVGQVLASPGIGARWIDKAKETGCYTFDHQKGTMDTYVLPNGTKCKLPTYYKNKLFTEREREENWRLFMDRHKQTIRGNTYDTKRTDEETITNITEKAREVNFQLEYGDNTGEWRKRPYNLTKRMLEKNIKNEQIKIQQKEERRKILQQLAERGVEVKKLFKK